MQIWLSEICWVWVSFVGWNSSFLQLLRKLIPALYLGCTAARPQQRAKWWVISVINWLKETIFWKDIKPNVIAVQCCPCFYLYWKTVKWCYNTNNLLENLSFSPDVLCGSKLAFRQKDRVRDQSSIHSWKPTFAKLKLGHWDKGHIKGRRVVVSIDS